MSEIAELEAQVRYHNARYWDDDAPEISDQDYDKLVRRLRELAPGSPILQSMGPSRAATGTSVTHAVPMLSLDKCYEAEELHEWAATFEGEAVAMPKFDGIACSIHYDAKGRLVRAVTRGDGLVGDDITENARQIRDIPKKLPVAKAIEVRGEIYMRLSVFERFKAEGMANPRNLAAGAIKQKDPKKSAAYGLSFAAYDLVGDAHGTQVAELEHLVALGFAPIDHFVLQREEMARGFEEFSNRRAQLDYEIDGVVYKVNLLKEQQRLGHTSHHPRYAIAYKFQGDAGTTTLVDIEWSVARTGAITPVAIVEPVALSGVTVTRASLHHAGFLEKLGLTIGARVVLVRRGGVIPNVEHVVEPGPTPATIPTACPSCGGAVSLRRDFLFCEQPSTCRKAIVGQLAHYAAATDMLGFGDSLLELAYDAGLLRSPADYYRLEWGPIAKLERCGEKIARKLVQEVEKKKRVPLDTFLRALGIPELGKKVSELLANQYGSLETVRALGEAELAASHGVGAITAKTVVDGLKELAPLIDDLLQFVEIVNPEKGGAAGPLQIESSTEAPIWIFSQVLRVGGGRTAGRFKVRPGPRCRCPEAARSAVHSGGADAKARGRGRAQVERCRGPAPATRV